MSIILLYLAGLNISGIKNLHKNYRAMNFLKQSALNIINEVYYKAKKYENEALKPNLCRAFIDMNVLKI